MNDFYTQYYHLQPKLEQYIKDKAINEIGLKLEIRLSLENEGKLKPTSITSMKIPVRLKDCDKQLEIELSTELLIDEKNKLKALMSSHRASDWEDMIKEGLQKYIMLNMTLHDFCIDLNRKYKDDIIGILEHLLTHDGRKVGFLSMEPIIPFSINDFLDIEDPKFTDIECGIQEYPDPVIIKNKLQMTLTDIGKYAASKVTDIKVWIKEKLDRIIHEELFNVEYIDLLLKFGPIEDQIRSKMEVESDKIGYKLRQIITVPDLKPLKLKENFIIEVL